jgi:uncharacterized protein YjiS (DUF1127 family)
MERGASLSPRCDQHSVGGNGNYLSIVLCGHFQRNVSDCWELISPGVNGGNAANGRGASQGLPHRGKQDDQHAFDCAALLCGESPVDERRPAIPVAIAQVLRLWRDRHRQRQELVIMSDRDLKDTGVPRDLGRARSPQMAVAAMESAITRVRGSGAAANVGPTRG